MTTNSGTAIAEDFLSTQVQLLEAGDTQTLSLRYAEDAVFVRFDFVARGRAEVKAMFDNYLQENPQVGEVVGVKITDDLLMYQASERLSGKLVWAVGTIYFENGLVKRQTAAFIDRPFEA
jgi:ketosteroid isomerase-like protein